MSDCATLCVGTVSFGKASHCPDCKSVMCCMPLLFFCPRKWQFVSFCAVGVRLELPNAHTLPSWRYSTADVQRVAA